MRKETIRAIVDIIVAENKNIIILEEEYWDETIDTKWHVARYENRHNELVYKIIDNRIFVDSKPLKIHDYIIDINGILRIADGHPLGSEFPYCVNGAGRLIVDESGIIKYIDNWSGHYKPTEQEFNNSLKFLNNLTIERKYIWDHSLFPIFPV